MPTPTRRPPQLVIVDRANLKALYMFDSVHNCAHHKYGCHFKDPKGIDRCAVLERIAAIIKLKESGARLSKLRKNLRKKFSCLLKGN